MKIIILFFRPFPQKKEEKKENAKKIKKNFFFFFFFVFGAEIAESKLRVCFRIIFNKYSSLSTRSCVENVGNYDYLLGWCCCCCWCSLVEGSTWNKKRRRRNNKLRITAWYFNKQFSQNFFSLTDCSREIFILIFLVIVMLWFYYKVVSLIVTSIRMIMDMDELFQTSFLVRASKDVALIL